MKLKDKATKQKISEDSLVEVKEDEDKEFNIEIQEASDACSKTPHDHSKHRAITHYADGRSIDDCFFPWNFPRDKN